MNEREDSEPFEIAYIGMSVIVNAAATALFVLGGMVWLIILATPVPV